MSAELAVEPGPEALLWIDLETTGLSAVACSIIEVAWCVERPGAARGEIRSAPIAPPPGAYWEPGARAMHERSGLADECRNGADLAAVECTIVGDLPPGARVYLAGSTVHFDLGFIREHMPALVAALHYRIVDVSSVRAFRQWSGEAFAKPEKAHRAADDLRQTLALADLLRGKPTTADSAHVFAGRVAPVTAARRKRGAP